MDLPLSAGDRADEGQLHLLRLVSLGLPVGGYAYSRGLEAAVSAGWVDDEASCAHWVLGMLESNLARLDGALFWRMTSSLEAARPDHFLRADGWLAASRETRELQDEDRRVGEALMRLLVELAVPAALDVGARTRTFAAAFALAAHHWRVDRSSALTGLMWTYVEAQVMAAVRLVPLGQTAGQRLLIAAVDPIRRAAATARTLTDEQIGACAPALAIASSWHETQYSRLFQS